MNDTIFMMNGAAGGMNGDRSIMIHVETIKSSTDYNYSQPPRHYNIEMLMLFSFFTYIL